MNKTDGLAEERIALTIRYRVCAECGANLKRSIENCQTVIVCEKFREHEGIANPYEERKFNIATRREFMTTEIGEQKTRALEKYIGVASLTKVQATEIIDTVWPGARKASPAEVYKAINICAQYGLNPLMRHLYLIPFGGKYVAVLGIGANRLIASRKHSYSYIDDTPRLMNDDEQMKVFGKVDAANLVSITVLKDSKTGATAPGYGKWPNNKNVQGEDKGNSPANMAFIRSERQALDRLYPMELPDAPVIDEQYGVSATIEEAAERPSEPIDTANAEQPAQTTAATLTDDGKNEEPPSVILLHESIQDLLHAKVWAPDDVTHMLKEMGAAGAGPLEKLKSLSPENYKKLVANVKRELAEIK